MRINFIRRSFRFDGGAEVAANSFINALSELGELQLICESWSGDLLNRIGLHEIGIQGYTRAKKYSNFISAASMLASSKNAITHSHEWTPGAEVLRLGDGLHSQWLDIRKVSNFIRKLDGYHRRKLRFEKESIQHPNLKVIICNSNYIKNQVLERYEIDASKLHVIRNIVTGKYKAFDPFSVDRLDNKLLFVGSGWERKGLSDALKAFALLPLEWTFDVVGADKSTYKYKKLAIDLGVDNRVNFLGAFPLTPEKYAQSTVMIHPALYEPFPNVATEALSQGVSIVSSHSSGTSDFDNNQGVWTVANDPQKLAENVLLASNVDKEDRKLFRQHILKFDEAYLDTEVRSLYSNLVAS